MSSDHHLLLQCPNCKMKFATKQELQNHTQKFCADSDYGNLNKLQRKLQAAQEQAQISPLNMEHNLSTKQVNSYIRQKITANPQQSKEMHLQNLRQQIENRQKRYNQNLDEYMRRREQEIKNIGKEKVQTRGTNQDQVALLDLMKEIQHRKEREVRALAEKEMIGQALVGLEKKKLNAIQAEKRRELTKLSAQREGLRLQQQQLLGEVEKLQVKMEEMDSNLDNQRNKIGLKVKSNTNDINQELLEKRQMELAKQRGEVVAELQQKRNDLQFKRSRIMNDLQNINKGNFSQMRKNFSGILAGNNILGGPVKSPNLSEQKYPPQEAVKMNEKWHGDYQKLEQLRQRHQNFLQNQPLLKIDQEKHQRQNLINGVDSIVSNTHVHQPKRRAKYFGYINEDLQRKDPMRPISQPKEQKPSVQQEIPKFKGPKFGDDPLHPLNTKSLDYTKQTNPQNYGFHQGYPPGPNQYPYQNPNLPYQFRNPQYPQYGYPPMPGQPPRPGYPPAGYPPFPYSPYGPPLNPSFHGQFPQQDQQSAQTLKLKKEMKKLKKKLKDKDKDNFYQGMQEALGQLQGRIEGPRSTPINREGMLPQQKVLQNVLRQQASQLRALAHLPKNSEIYQAKLDHYNQMSQIRMRMQGMLQQLTIQRMKRNFDREMNLEQQKLINQQWLEQQKRALIAAKIQPTKTASPTQVPLGKYDPEAGFLVFWDFVTGIPLRYKLTQVVYGLYQRGEVRLDPKLVAPVGTQIDPINSIALRAIFGTDQDVKKVPPYSLILLVIQVQGIAPTPDHPQGKLSNVGWTVIDLFKQSRKLNEGAWKVPLYRPPTDSSIEVRDIHSLVKVPNSFIYLRLVPSQGSSPFLSMEVNADETSKYRIPRIHTREIHPEGYEDEEPVQTFEQNNKSITPSIAQPTPQIVKYNLPQNKGISIQLESLISMVTRSYLQFKVYIQLGETLCVDDLRRKCIWSTEPINPQKRDIVSRVSRISQRQSSGSKELPIQLNHSFRHDFYQELETIRWEEGLFLVVEIMEQSGGRVTTAQALGQSSYTQTSYLTTAWTVFQLSNPATQLFNFGTFELNLYMPPVTVPLYSDTVLRQKEGNLRVTIYQTTDRQASARSKGLVQDEPQSEPFLQNLTPQYNDAEFFQNGDGFDFYIDGARFLPDNTTCTKLIVRAYNSNLEQVGQVSGALPQFDSPVYSPQFGFRVQFRGPSFDPTMIVVVAIITIDSKNNEVRVLGYSVFNVFLDKFRKQQPESSAHQEYILNKGCHQIPIYCQQPYRNPPFNIQSFRKLEKIPCATLLVRLIQAPNTRDRKALSTKDVMKSEWYSRGLVVPPPNYKDRVYYTEEVTPTNIQRYMYRDKMQRPVKSVKEATQDAQKALNMHVDHREDDLETWVDETLQVSSRTPMLDPKFFSQYNPKLGFKVAIDAIHNTPSMDPHVVVFSLNPPASLYTSHVISNDVQFTLKMDWTSALRTPQFIDGFHSYKNVEFNENLHILFDIRSVAVNKRKVQVKSIGWTILSVFQRDGYVNSGVYQIPVFKGPVPTSILAELSSTEAWEYLMNTMKKASGPQFLEPTSVIVRLVDTQRDGHFLVPMDLNRMNYKYIPEFALQKFSYNAAAAARNQQGKRLKSIIQSNSNPDRFIQTLKTAISEELGLANRE